MGLGVGGMIWASYITMTEEKRYDREGEKIIKWLMIITIKTLMIIITREVETGSIYRVGNEIITNSRVYGNIVIIICIIYRTKE